jgi:hypothetical protein
MDLVWHFLKRILRYDVPVGAAGALVSGSQHPLTSSAGIAASALELAIRFVVIAGTAGFAFSFLLYTWLGRRELPLYTVCGRHLGRVAFTSFCILALSLSALLAAGLVVLRWARP